MTENEFQPTFPSLRKAAKALYKKGFEISKSKMQRDKQNGLIDFNKDGTVDQREVEKYARLLKKREADLGDNKEIQGRETLRL